MNLSTTLTQLETEQLLRRLSEPDLAYLFKHTLTQETAYQSLLRENRREMHRRVAQAYEQIFSDALDDHAAILATHYENAGDDAKTLEYSIRAGDAAARKYANAEAILHYARAVEIAKSATHLASASHLSDLFLKLGRVYEIASRYTDALRLYDDMIALAQTRADRALELAALVARGTLHSAPTPLFDPEKGTTMAMHALELARELTDQPAEAKILWNLSLLNGMQGHRNEAVTYGEQSLAIARANNLREQTAFTLTDIYRAYVSDGQVRRGLAALEEARALWRELDNQPMLVDTLSSTTMLYYFTGNYAESVDFHHQALELAERIDNLWNQSFCRHSVGNIFFERGDPTYAIETMEKSIHFGIKAGFIVPEIWTQADLGWVWASLGQYDRALKSAQAAHAQAEAHFQRWRPNTLAILSRIHTARGDPAAAEDYLQQARHLLAAGEFIWAGEFHLGIAEAEFEMTRGDFARAAQMAEQLIAREQAMEFAFSIHAAQCVRGQALLALNRLDEAGAALAEAQRVADTRGSKWILWHVFAAQSELQTRLGNRDAAAELRAQAREIITRIAEKTPADARASFLNLPKVRAVTE
ncbi:MAG: tetratricopeptide repeat protein [Chloroflexi bacterium]|nr:tetratricopeptide repeat protein [Chloroflexota bacterium]